MLQDVSLIHMTPSAELKSVMFVNINKTFMADQYLIITLWTLIVCILKYYCYVHFFFYIKIKLQNVVATVSQKIYYSKKYYFNVFVYTCHGNTPTSLPLPLAH